MARGGAIEARMGFEGTLASAGYQRMATGLAKGLSAAVGSGLMKAMGEMFAAGVSGIAAPSSRNRSIVHAIFASMFGWGSAGQLAATDQLLMHESGYRNTAQNPTSTAYGMFQFLNSTWAGTGIGKTSDPRLQAIAGGRYIASGYGSPAGAWNFWQGHHWYDNGGWLQPGVTVAHNTTGRPEPVGRTRGTATINVHFHGPVYGDRQVLSAQVRSDIRAALRREGKPVTV
jgi:hypothetical protein